MIYALVSIAILLIVIFVLALHVAFCRFETKAQDAEIELLEARNQLLTMKALDLERQLKDAGGRS